MATKKSTATQPVKAAAAKGDTSAPLPTKPSRLQTALSHNLLQTVKTHSEATSSLPNTDTLIVRELLVELIDRCKFQPRSEFDPVELEELADNIDKNGLIQPVEVRLSGGEGRYELIVGERRLRAHKLLGKRHIRAIINNNITDDEVSARAISENIQRANLSDLELYRSIKLHKETFPKSSYAHETLGLPKTDYFRLQSFDEFPPNVIELLVLRPRMVSSVTAEKTKQYIKAGIEQGRFDRKTVDKELKTIIQKAIDSNTKRLTTVAVLLETKLEPGQTRTQARKLMSDDKLVANIITAGKYLQLKVPKDSISEEKQKKLEEFLVELLKDSGE